VHIFFDGTRTSVCVRIIFFTGGVLRVRPAEHLMGIIDLIGGRLMRRGLLDLLKVIRSEGSGYPVYNWWCGFRIIARKPVRCNGNKSKDFVLNT
jgi:hypothetical protein